MQQQPNYTGLCLVASPHLNDSFFAQSVIFMAQHDKTGAMGYVVNKISDVKISELLKQINIKHQTSLNYPVLDGGPVQADVGFVLHKGQAWWNASYAVQNSNYCITTSKDILQTIATNEGVNKFNLLLGYSGWLAGQLEFEVKQGDWFSCAADDDILFNLPEADRWHYALNQCGVDIRWLVEDVGHA